MLRKWGPNHACDALVTRFNVDQNCIEFIAIKRQDSGEWALPGGFQEEDENPEETAKREFGEEVCRVRDSKMLDSLFANSRVVYEGIVLDPRSTDNSWIETKCFLVFIDDQKLAEELPIRGGDDAKRARWIVANDRSDEFTRMYANHRDIVLGASQMITRS
jgi:ADP-ribose pyrophosphatase YjhB (NUDIX family)